MVCSLIFLLVTALQMLLLCAAAFASVYTRTISAPAFTECVYRGTTSIAWFLLVCLLCSGLFIVYKTDPHTYWESFPPYQLNFINDGAFPALGQAFNQAAHCR
ncbi:hypothetical protein RQN30_11375 [Arcanobacterium hippocoleae]